MHMLLLRDRRQSDLRFAMYAARRASVSVLLLALLWESGNFFTMKKGGSDRDANGAAYCRMPDRCNVEGFENWFKVDDRCVQYFISPLNFTQAEFSCRSRVPGGHLVSVHNKKANDDLLCIVEKMNPKNLRVWIGGYEFFQSGRFLWTDGSFWDYQIWTPGEPSNIFSNAEECVEMNWNHVGKWNDVLCSTTKNYICAFKRKHLIDE